MTWFDDASCDDVQRSAARPGSARRRRASCVPCSAKTRSGVRLREEIDEPADEQIERRLEDPDGDRGEEQHAEPEPHRPQVVPGEAAHRMPAASRLRRRARRGRCGARASRTSNSSHGVLACRPSEAIATGRPRTAPASLDERRIAAMTAGDDPPRPLPARHPAEHRHDAAPGRLPRRRRSTSSSRPASTSPTATSAAPGSTISTGSRSPATPPGALSRPGGASRACGSCSRPRRAATALHGASPSRAGRHHSGRPRIGRRAGRGARGRGRARRRADAAGPALAQRRGRGRDDPRRGAAADRRLSRSRAPAMRELPMPRAPDSPCPIPSPSHRLKAKRRPGSRRCATASAPPSRRSRTRPPARSIPRRRRAGRFERKPWERTRPCRRAGRRRRDGDDARPRVREGRRPRLDRARRVRAGVPRPDPGLGRGPALLGRRHLAHRPSLEPARPDGAHEHPLRRHDEALVRRRRRPHARCSTAAARQDDPDTRRLPRRDARRLRRATVRARLRRATRPGATSTSS